MRPAAAKDCAATLAAATAVASSPASVAMTMTGVEDDDQHQRPQHPYRPQRRVDFLVDDDDHEDAVNDAGEADERRTHREGFLTVPNEHLGNGMGPANGRQGQGNTTVTNEVSPHTVGTTTRNSSAGTSRQHDHEQVRQRADSRRSPSSSFINDNERLLGIAFVSFMSFALTELVFATRAKSHAMLGDAVAMMVDSLAYLFNWIAERSKNRHFPSDEAVVDPKRRRRCRRKRALQLEIVPPVVSVSILVAVTIVVTGNAVKVLRSSKRPTTMPDLRIMMLFSIFNLFLDAVNVFCFSKSKENLGIRPEVTTTTMSYGKVANTDDGDDGGHDGDHEHDDHDDDDDTNHDKDPNMNMCSAFTHVFADTLRSLAVIVASAIGLSVVAVEPDRADAIAAIVVSLLIALSLVPLVQGLLKSMAELRAIVAEEVSETMFAESSRSEFELT
jgi:Co/Zn/Cd efflux system component